jgi:hypothetical protein
VMMVVQQLQAAARRGVLLVRALPEWRGVA